MYRGLIPQQYELVRAIRGLGFDETGQRAPDTSAVKAALQSLLPVDVWGAVMDFSNPQEFEYYFSPGLRLSPSHIHNSWVEILAEPLHQYWRETLPERWDLEILEFLGKNWLQSRYPFGYSLPDVFKWRFAFQQFVKGPIQPDGHSEFLYRQVFLMFKSTAYALQYFPDPMQMDLGFVKGMIKMGKEGRYLWEFDEFIKQK